MKGNWFSIEKALEKNKQGIQHIRDSWYRRVILESDLFDINYYNEQYGKNFSEAEGLEHYLSFGWKEHKNPSAIFSTQSYLDQYLDVAEAGVCPLLHYVMYGKREHRKAFRDESAFLLDEGLYKKEQYVFPIHCVYHAWLVKELMGDQIAIKSTGIPMVLHTHGLFSIGLGEPGMSYQYQAATQKNGYALCDVVVTLGEVDTAWWNSLGYRAVKTINPSTYDVHTVQPASLKGKNVLWVGRVSEQKQVYEAFRVIQLVHEKVPDVRLQIVGSAETEEAMRQVREYLSLQGMESYVSLEGFQRDVRPYYEQAALVLWTAGFEGAPMGMVEAKAYGLPIVCYELANVDMVRKPKGMRVVRQKDCAEAAKQVVALLEDDALRTELGRESRESAEEISSFDLETHWQHILDLAMQPKAEERMASQLTPMETTAQMAMDFLVKGMDYRVRVGDAGNESGQINEDRMAKVKALEELYLDGYFVKAYMWLNRLFPKGGKAREILKRVASIFFK